MRPAALARASGTVLVVLLAFGILTLWVPQRWALSAYQAGAFLLAGAWMLRLTLRPFPIAGSPALIALAGAVLWGCVQAVAGLTVYPWETWNAVLNWGAACVLFWVALQAFGDPALRRRFLNALLYFGFGLSVVSTLQMFTSEGKIFWFFESGYSNFVLGPFVYRNQYAAFIETVLPLALYRALRERERSFRYWAMAAVMVASVVAGASRAGSALVLAEVLLVPLLALGRRMVPARTVGLALAQFALLGVAAAAVVGGQSLWERFQQADPYAVRREMLLSSVEMVRSRPWTGFGLGTWSTVYPQYALYDDGLFANEAHNDWAQWAVEGGIPLLAMMAAFAALMVKPALRSMWGIGVIAVLVHCVVDYPMQQRPALVGWYMALAGALAASSRTPLRASLRRSSGRMTGVGAALLLLLLLPARVAATGLNDDLLAAAGRGSAAEVFALLARGADPNAHDTDGQTALIAGILNGSTDVPRALLEAGADPNLAGPHGWTPLMRAAAIGAAGTMEELLKAGAEVKRADANGWTALAFAAAGGHAAIVQRLLGQGADPGARTSKGESALYLAVWKGSAKTVGALLARHPDVNAADSRGMSPLALAVSRGDTRVAQMLRKAGARAQTADSKPEPKTAESDPDGWTPLLRAVREGKGDAVRRLLMQGADVNAAAPDGTTPLMLAAIRGDASMTKALLDRSANANAVDRQGLAALELAVATGRADVIRLLEKAGAKIPTPAPPQAPAKPPEKPVAEPVPLPAPTPQTPVPPAEVDVDQREPDGSTPLMAAAIRGDVPEMKALLGREAAVNATGREGSTALMLAAAEGHAEAVNLLLEHKADIAARSADGWTALQWAVAGGHLEAVKLLLAAGADPDTTDTEGWTPLLRAAQNGAAGIAEALLGRGANIARRAPDGGTSLMLAAWNGHPEVVKLLLARGVDRDARDNDGQTALSYAKRRGHAGIIRLLEDSGAK